MYRKEEYWTECLSELDRNQRISTKLNARIMFERLERAELDLCSGLARVVAMFGIGHSAIELFEGLTCGRVNFLQHRSKLCMRV